MAKTSTPPRRAGTTPLHTRPIDKDGAVAVSPADRPIKVRATQLGYYDDQRRRLGDVFTIRSAHEFSENWMEPVDGRVPEKTTGPQAALNRELHQVAVEQAGAGLGQGADEDPANTGVLGD